MMLSSPPRFKNETSEDKLMRQRSPSITKGSNMLLARKWDFMFYNEHQRKLRKIKAVIDNKAPRSYLHLHCKLNKLQADQHRMALIERDNRLLMERISHTLRTRGRVDNKNDYEMKSMNAIERQKMLLKITHENQAILKRLLTKEPVIHHIEQLHEFDVNQRYMANISKYPWMYLDRITPKDYTPADFERRRIEYLRRRRFLHPENEALVAADERRRTIYAESDVDLMRALTEGHRRKSKFQRRPTGWESSLHHDPDAVDDDLPEASGSSPLPEEISPAPDESSPTAEESPAAAEAESTGEVKPAGSTRSTPKMSRSSLRRGSSHGSRKGSKKASRASVKLAEAEPTATGSAADVGERRASAQDGATSDRGSACSLGSGKSGRSSTCSLARLTSPAAEEVEEAEAAAPAADSQEEAPAQTVEEEEGPLTPNPSPDGAAAADAPAE